MYLTKAVIMTYINITEFVLTNQLEKDHSMIETRRLKSVEIFIQWKNTNLFLLV